MPASLHIRFASQQLRLLADRSLYWVEQKTLVLADVHLGKDAAFRAAGLAVPAGNSRKDLARIEALLAETKADRLVVLGDLVHSRSSHQAELSDAFTKWRSAHQQLEILLIRGNHDRHAGLPPAGWKITQVPEPFETKEFCLSHFPREHELPVLCGHMHPTVSVRDFDGTSVAVPCFVLDPSQLILPAFGSFTGGCRTRHEPDRKIYATMGKSVVQIQPERA